MMHPTTQNAVEHIVNNLRDQDILELYYHRGRFVPSEIVSDIMDSAGFGIVCYTPDNEPVAVGGINDEDERFSTAWAIGTNRFAEKAIEITRASRVFCSQFVQQNPHKDLMAFSWNGHAMSGSWLQAVGFEVAQEKRHNGQPFTLFMMPRGEDG